MLLRNFCKGVVRIKSGRYSETMPTQTVLRKSPLFKGWNEKDLSTLEDFSTSRALSAGETLFHEGEEADSFYIIVSGTMQVKKSTRDGNEEALTTLGSGTFFGELSMFHKESATEKRSATTHAVETSKLLEVPYKEFEAFLEKSPDAARHFYKNIAIHLASRIRQTSEDLAGLRALKLRHF